MCHHHKVECARGFAGLKGLFQQATIDYVWATKNLEVEAVMQPLRDSKRPPLYLPNHKHPSDHLPLGVIFR